MPGRHAIQHAVTAALLGCLMLLVLVAARSVPSRGPTLAADRAAALDVTSSALVTQAASTRYNAAAAVAEALTYAQLEDNRDGCYIYADRPTGANPRCGAENGKAPFDGAHFVACVLDAGGLIPPANFDSLCKGNNRYVSMPYLYEMLQSIPTVTRSAAEAQLGDIVILTYKGTSSACWGGVVVKTGVANKSGVEVATHSSDGGYSDPETSICHNATGQDVATDAVYMHIVSDTTPPTVAFSAPQAGNVPFGSTQHLVWQGDDGADGSGVASYRLTQSIAGAPPTDLGGAIGAAQTSFDVQMDLGCHPITFAITATDQAGNVSPASTLALTATLQGDFDLNGAIDQADLARVEAAWGLRSGQAGYDAQLDINADGRIDAADTLWLRRRLGDRCW